MTSLLLVLLLSASAATPTPTPAPNPVPAPKRTPVTAAGYGGGRSLSDVARERKLAREKGGTTGKKGTLNVAPAAAAGTPPAGSPIPDAGAAAPAGGPAPRVVVESAENGGVGSNALVRIFGRVRNAGDAPACDVAVTVRLYDEKNQYLVSGGGRIDEPLLRPGMTSSFSVWVQIPPGVGGMPKDKTLGYGTSGPGGTLEGRWRGLGQTEAEVVSVGACPAEAGREKDAARPEETPPQR